MERIITASPSYPVIFYMILNSENPLKWFSVGCVVAFAEFGLGITSRRLHALKLSSFNIKTSNILL
jgi:hypothetical protein